MDKNKRIRNNINKKKHTYCGSSNLRFTSNEANAYSVRAFEIETKPNYN